MRTVTTTLVLLFVAVYCYLVGRRHGVQHGISVGRVRELVNEGYSIHQAHYRLKTDPMGREYPAEYNPNNYPR